MAFDQRNYYRENKARIAKQRKSRYENDPDYRRGIKSRAILRKRANRSEPTEKGVIITSQGTFITIGRLAKFIGREIRTIRTYHRTGILPTPTHFDTRGWRLYTTNQAILIKAAFESLDRGELAGLKDIFGLVNKEWEEEDGQKSDKTRKKTASKKSK